MSIVAVNVNKKDKKVIVCTDSQHSYSSFCVSGVKPKAEILRENGQKLLYSGVGLSKRMSLFKSFTQRHDVLRSLSKKSSQESTMIEMMSEFHDYVGGLIERDEKIRGDDAKNFDGRFLFVYQKEEDLTEPIVWIYEYLNIFRINDFYAIGSGKTAAIAARLAGASTRRCCEIACELSTGCGGEINTYEFSYQ